MSPTRPRPSAVLRATLATALLAAAVAPAAGAAIVATSVSGFEGGPALAADGRVVVGERRGNGALRILSIDPRSGAKTPIAAFGAVAKATTYPDLHIWGTGGVVTAAIDTYGQFDADEENAVAPLLRTRTLVIAPALFPLASCDAPRPAAQHAAPHPQLDARGGDGFLATIGDDCAPVTASIRLRTASGSLTVAAEAGTRSISELRATGPYVSWIENRGGDLAPVARTLVLARGATGEVLLRAPLERAQDQVGLGADGTVALPDFPACAIRVLSPAAPSPRTIALSHPTGLGCYSVSGVARGQGSVSIAGGRIVYAARPYSGYAVTDLQGNAHALAEAHLQGSNRVSPIALDGRTAYIVRTDCDRDRLLAVDTDVSAQPPAQSGGGDPCPVRRAGSGRLRVGGDGRVAISLRCTAGCRGTLRLVEQRGGRRERLVGRAAYVARAGRLVVRPRLASYARRLAGCAGGLRVAAIVHPLGEDLRTEQSGRGRGLGAYRIRSRSTCRRGGPAFTAPRPGPRP